MQPYDTTKKEDGQDFFLTRFILSHCKFCFPVEIQEKDHGWIKRPLIGRATTSDETAWNETLNLYPYTPRRDIIDSLQEIKKQHYTAFGYITLAAGFVVLDTDNFLSAKLLAVLLDNEDFDLRKIPRVKTGKGFHFYFRAPDHDTLRRYDLFRSVNGLFDADKIPQKILDDIGIKREEVAIDWRAGANLFLVAPGSRARDGRKQWAVEQWPLDPTADLSLETDRATYMRAFPLMDDRILEILSRYKKGGSGGGGVNLNFFDNSKTTHKIESQGQSPTVASVAPVPVPEQSSNLITFPIAPRAAIKKGEVPYLYHLAREIAAAHKQWARTDPRPLDEHQGGKGYDAWIRYGMSLVRVFGLKEAFALYRMVSADHISDDDLMKKMQTFTQEREGKTITTGPIREMAEAYGVDMRQYDTKPARVIDESIFDQIDLRYDAKDWAPIDVYALPACLRWYSTKKKRAIFFLSDKTRKLLFRLYGLEVIFETTAKKAVAKDGERAVDMTAIAHLYHTIKDINSLDQEKEKEDLALDYELSQRKRDFIREWLDEQRPKADRGEAFEKLCKAVDVEEGQEEIKKVYLRKFVRQCVAVHYQDEIKKATGLPFQQRGVLTLQGEQGIGKTTFFRTVLPRIPMMEELELSSHIYGDGVALKDLDKDAIMRATSYWIAELGEAEQIISRAALGDLKAFLTQSVDTYRAPYGRDVKTYRRQTVFVASVNFDRFLKDETGSTRWWILKVKTFHRDILQTIDHSALWGWAVEDFMKALEEDPWTTYHLSQEEDAMREKINVDAEEMDAVEILFERVYRADYAPGYVEVKETAEKIRQTLLSLFRESDEALYDEIRRMTTMTFYKRLGKIVRKNKIKKTKKTNEMHLFKSVKEEPDAPAPF